MVPQHRASTHHRVNLNSNRRSNAAGGASEFQVVRVLREVRDEGGRHVRPAAVSRQLFEGILSRELKRTHRSNEPLFLLQLANDYPTAGSGSSWEAVLDAVAAATRETDVVGWLEPGKEVGVILTDTRASQMPIARNLETRIRTELSKRLSQAAAHRLSIRFQVYPNRDCAAGNAVVFDGTSAAGKCAKPYDAMKRRLDALGSATLLALLSPVFLVIAALIKLTSRGPVFYRQVRVGYMANPFTMLKFRTMRVDADHALHQEFVTNFIKSTGAVNSDKDKFFKITNDPRVTPVGRFLRKTSLDELPQLWNVVRGDMSLVGPRPPLPYEVAEYQAWHRRRLTDARPGITGLWQVTGRSRTTFEDMVRLDLQYARTRSLTMDLKILLATPAAVVGGKGAC